MRPSRSRIFELPLSPREFNCVWFDASSEWFEIQTNQRSDSIVPAHFCEFFRHFFKRANRSKRRALRHVPSTLLETLETRALPSAASVIVVQDPGLFTTEAGGTAQFSVVLSAAPTPARKALTVTVPIQSSNAHEGKPSVSSLTFTSANWNVPQTVTVTGIDDFAVDGNRAYKIELGKVTTKARNYRRVDPTDVTLVNEDNDGPAPQLIFSPGPFVLNDAVSRVVSLRLASQPLADVNVAFNVLAGADQAQLSTASLTFTSSNWNVAQKFTIGAFEDDIHDGDQPFTLGMNVQSTDPAYDQLAVPPYTVTIHDTDPLTGSLDGTYSGTFSGSQLVGGASTPTTGEVAFTVAGSTLAVTSPAGSTGTVNAGQITFTAANGATYTGAFLQKSDGSISATGAWQILQNGVSTGSGTWSAIDSGHVTAGLNITPSGSLVVDEGSQQALSVSLSSKPTADVQVAFDVTTGDTEANLSTPSLTFTPENWFTPQTVTIAGVADDGADGDQPFEFTATADSADEAYSVLAPKTIAATIHDTDSSAATLDGNYTGTYTGTVSAVVPVGGVIAFSVAGDVVTVTQPAAATGTLTGNDVSFSPTSGSLSGAHFTGSFVQNDDGTVTASGVWSISSGLVTGSGAWTATRPALV
jgi:hypothetical protein